MARKQIKGSAKKRLFKGKDLCYSIGEADSVLSAQISWVASTRANGGDISANNSFNIGWRHITKEELPANMDSDSKVCPIGIFIVGFMEDYRKGDQFCEVVHDKPGKDFLANVLHFFCVKMQQANCVFEFPERGFNAPAHGIEAFELVRGKIEICDDSFDGAVRQFETDNAERDLEGRNGDRLFIFHGEEIKNGVIGEQLKKWGSLGQSFGLIGLLTGKGEIDLNIKFFGIGNG